MVETKNKTTMPDRQIEDGHGKWPVIDYTNATGEPFDMSIPEDDTSETE